MLTCCGLPEQLVLIVVHSSLYPEDEVFSTQPPAPQELANSVIPSDNVAFKIVTQIGTLRLLHRLGCKTPLHGGRDVVSLM